MKILLINPPCDQRNIGLENMARDGSGDAEAEARKWGRKRGRC